MKPYIEKLIDYNYWANGLIIKNAEKLSTEQFVAENEFFKASLREILSHTMFAEWIWMDRMQGIKKSRDEMRAFYQAENYPALQDLIKDWFDLELRMRAFLGEMSDEQVMGIFKYTRSSGQELEYRYGDIFTQLAFHGMQHRSECAAILTSLGHSPGNIDYLTYIWV